jgi:hypothetical protein
VQDKGQHGTLTSVPQGSCQADVPFQAHLRLLEVLEWERQHIIMLRSILLKVTILMGYSFQTSSNKERIDLYNPITKMANVFLF